MKELLIQSMKADDKVYNYRKNNHAIFTPKEWVKFYRTAKPLKRMMFDLLINTGARIKEARGIRKKDINFKDNLITILDVKKRTPYADGKIRVIKISSQFCKRLELYCENLSDDDKIIPAKFNNGVSQLFKRYLKKSGLNERNYSLHNIRKTTICWLNFLGVNPLLVLKHMGHNSETCLKHYLLTDTYNAKMKWEARQIIGDLYM